LVDVSGRVRSNTYTDRNNETRHQWVMKVEQWSLAGQQQTQPAATARPAAAAAAPAQPTAWATSNDDDFGVPF
jgi:single-stranded DNA-binding protein